MRLIYTDKNPHADTTICIYLEEELYLVEEVDKQGCRKERGMYTSSIDKHELIQAVRRTAGLWDTSAAYKPIHSYFDYNKDAFVVGNVPRSNYDLGITEFKKDGITFLKPLRGAPLIFSKEK